MAPSARHGAPKIAPRFIDLFAGCGGFSLGFCRAGWQGVLAVERDASAFRTFAYNFLDDATAGHPFDWPTWFPRKQTDIRNALREYAAELRHLRGTIDAVIGGPPCQGFSFAGRRRKTDRRNQLFRAYIEFVAIVRPRYVLMENVLGITVAHGTTSRKRTSGGRAGTPYSTRVVNALKELGYKTSKPQLILASDFGVPQRRPRVFFFAYLPTIDGETPNLFEDLAAARKDFLRSRRLPLRRAVTVEEALSDLRYGHGTVPCLDEQSPPGFEQGIYGARASTYQNLLRKGVSRAAATQSHRFANHATTTRERFARIHNECRKGVQLTAKERDYFSISKHVVIPLRGDQVGHTLTTLPDDYIHYEEPRILTVREYARLQSFPDSFRFLGPFTTGGRQRTTTCPRYTQIGNAVPPLLAEAVAATLQALAGTT